MRLGTLESHIQGSQPAGGGRMFCDGGEVMSGERESWNETERRRLTMVKNDDAKE